jgi:amino acid transporter
VKVHTACLTCRKRLFAFSLPGLDEHSAHFTIMAITRTSGSSEGGSPHHSDPELYGKSEYTTGATAEPVVDSDGVVRHQESGHLHRGLKSRHITMIAIGGAIGTGLIIGTGKALAQSG